MNQPNEAMAAKLLAEADIDPQETLEWLAALGSMFEADGAERVHFLLQQLADEARRRGEGQLGADRRADDEVEVRRDHAGVGQGVPGR